MSHKAQRRPRSAEIWLAATKHDRVQVDSILIDQAKLGEALRQVRAGNFDLPVALGLQRADRTLKIILDKPGVEADRLQRARDDPLRLVPPRRREGAFLCIPFRVIVVPVTHDLVHPATVHTARLSLSLLDEVAEERGAWRKRVMVDVAVQGLVHSEHEPGHHFLSRRNPVEPVEIPRKRARLPPTVYTPEMGFDKEKSLGSPLRYRSALTDRIGPSYRPILTLRLSLI